MKYAMLGFAGIAFLVGIFLIVNTFSMLVAQRTREIGLMRAIGSSRRQVNRSVLVEALLLGVVGSMLGVGAGVGLAVGLMKLMGAMGMNLSTDELTVSLDHPGRRPASSASSSPSSPRTCPPGGPARSPRWPRCATPAPRPTAGPARYAAVLGLLLTGAGGCGAVSRPRRPTRRARARCCSARGVVLIAHRLRRHRPAARGRRGAGAQRGRAAALRPGRPDGRAQRAAQPAPYGGHRRRADDRPRAGRLPVGGRLLDGRLGHGGARQVGRRGLHHPVRQRPADHAAGRREGARRPPSIWSTSPTYKMRRRRAHHARRQDARTSGAHRGRPDVRAGPAPRDGRGRPRRPPTARTRCPSATTYAKKHGVKVGDTIDGRLQGRRQHGRS